MSGERVLVVDDEPQIRRALQIALTKYGYRVELAEDGESVFVPRPGICMNPKPSSSTWSCLGLLDLICCAMSGNSAKFQLSSSLRGVESRTRSTPLILVPDDYLTKPFGVDELLARVRALLRRMGEPASSLVKFGPVTVDLTARVVRRAGEEVHLSPRSSSFSARSPSMQAR